MFRAQGLMNHSWHHMPWLAWHNKKKGPRPHTFTSQHPMSWLALSSIKSLRLHFIVSRNHMSWPLPTPMKKLMASFLCRNIKCHDQFALTKKPKASFHVTWLILQRKLTTPSFVTSSFSKKHKWFQVEEKWKPSFLKKISNSKLPRVAH